MKQILVITLTVIAALSQTIGQTIDKRAASSGKAVAQYRKRIDAIDKHIISLLNERAKIALEIGRIRQRENIPPASARGREEEVLRKAMAHSAAPLSPEAARRIYERIIAEMVELQKLDSAKEINVLAPTSNEEKQVRQAVQSFYDDFNSPNFGRQAEYAAEDWNHINPFGGLTRGRQTVLKELEEVHSTFLKGVSATIEDMSVRFANPDIAIVTVINQMDTYTTPDRFKHENER